MALKHNLCILLTTTANRKSLLMNTQVQYARRKSKVMNDHMANMTYVAQIWKHHNISVSMTIHSEACRLSSVQHRSKANWTRCGVLSALHLGSPGQLHVFGDLAASVWSMEALVGTVLVDLPVLQHVHENYAQVQCSQKYSICTSTLLF